MNKFGLIEFCGRKTFVEWSRGRSICWINVSSEPIIVNPDEIDFDVDHVTEFLLSEEGRYCWGTYLPEEIVDKLGEKIDKEDEWLNRELNYLKRNFSKYKA